MSAAENAPNVETSPVTPTRQLRPSAAALRHRSSDYLVLERVGSWHQEINLPRPRFWYLPAIFAILDGSWTVLFAIKNGRDESREEIALMCWGGVRALAILLASISVRVRETGWLFVGSALISALSALADLNLLIQNSTWTSQLSKYSILYCASHVFFGLLHWLGFAAIVGVTKERNPYGLGLQTARQSAWREGMSNVEVRRSSFADEPASYTDQNGEEWDEEVHARRRANEASFLSEEDEEAISSDDDDFPIDERDQREAEEDDEDDAFGSEDEGNKHNNIIDIIPSPSTTRHRTISQSHSHRSVRYRRSFYRAGNNGSPEEAQLSPVAPTSGYGTFSNLAGI